MRNVAIGLYMLHDCRRQLVNEVGFWAPSIATESSMSGSDENQNQTAQTHYIPETTTTQRTSHRQMEGVALV